jgi:Radical SAM superfamily
VISVRAAPAVGADRRTREMAELKVRLLSLGARLELDPSAEARMKPILRVRSGSCGGLDLVLPDGTWVNCPVREPFAKRSPIRLVSEGSRTVLCDEGLRLPVDLVPAPAYYRRAAPSGAPMSRLGQLCSDRIGIGLTNACTYYRSASQRCRFCSIGRNGRDEDPHKETDDIVATVMAAIEDPVAPARHVLLGGGTPEGADSGAVRIAEVAAAIRQRSQVSIYAMLVPPRDFGYLDLLADAGVDEVGLNIEVFEEESARRYIPGKHAAAGLDLYRRALEHCVGRFGPLNTRSITVVGLDSEAATVRGVGELAAMGVLPILSPLRRLAGTQLENHEVPDQAALWRLTLAAAEAADASGVPLGPLCIGCQANTLTVPGDPLYRLY